MEKVSIDESMKKYINLKQQVWTGINREIHEGLLKRHPNISFIVVRVCIIQSIKMNIPFCVSFTNLKVNCIHKICEKLLVTLLTYY